MTIDIKIRFGIDGKYYISIPSLGIDTYAENKSDVQISIKEVIACYCIACEKFGLGLKEELHHNNHTTLTGEDAKIFNDAISNTKQVSKEEFDRMKKNYNILKSRERF